MADLGQLATAIPLVARVPHEFPLEHPRGLDDKEYQDLVWIAALLVVTVGHHDIAPFKYKCFSVIVTTQVVLVKVLDDMTIKSSALLLFPDSVTRYPRKSVHLPHSANFVLNLFNRQKESALSFDNYPPASQAPQNP